MFFHVFEFVLIKTYLPPFKIVTYIREKQVIGGGLYLFQIPQISFYCILLYCAPQILWFLQIESKTLHQQKDYDSQKAQVTVSIS